MTDIVNIVKRLRSSAQFCGTGVNICSFDFAEELRYAADEIERLRSEVAALNESAAQLYDIAASGADPLKRLRMLDRMALESFAENG